MNITKDQFGPNFYFGVSTAAYQIEGAINKDGKGLSIWDDFVAKKGKILNNESGKDACKFYDNYAKDITMMAHLNIPNYRFSISWSRILPCGIGKVNKNGIDFYNRVIDLCLELGIEPWVTLYHWDLPLELQKKGGWVNRDIINWFSSYINCCLIHFGDKVKKWMVINEPMVFTGAGYFLGKHAPGKKGLANFLPAIHHAAICQAEGGRIIKSFNSNFDVGTTISCSHIEPFSKEQNDVDAAIRIDALLNRLFIEPLLGLGYPVKDLKILEKLEQYILPGDDKKLAFEMDFIGIQCYTREIVKYNPLIPYVKANILKAEHRKVDRTLMGWEVYPLSIYHILKKFNTYPQIKQMIVTENGAAFKDYPSGKLVHDEKRVTYLKDHLCQLFKAKQEGAKVEGYFIWTLLDNFEWAEGFNPRFGLVYVDFKTQKRIIKNSGKWFGNFLSGRS